MRWVGWLKRRTDEDGLMSTNFKLFICLFSGVCLAVISIVLTDTLYKDNLKSRSQTIAIALDANDIHTLSTLDESAEIDRQYVALKLQLAKLKLVNDDARSISVVGQNYAGIFTVADSESTDSPIYSARGAEYMTKNLELSQLFNSKNATAIGGPRSEGTDTFLTSFATIFDQTKGEVIGLVALDIPVTTYYSLLSLSALIPLLIAMGVAIVIIVMDRSRTRRLESLRLRSELVSIASHELRTPLTGIRWGEEQLLKEKSITHSVKQNLQTMYDSTLKLQESIEDVLQLASLQNKRANLLNITPVNMTTLIEGIFATQKLTASQHHITLAFDQAWPKELIIPCDNLRMKRVLNNLVSNAIKYTRPRTSVIISYDKTEAGHIIMITDEGIGIPEDEQEKVFSGFYRATNAVQKETNGTGMGLYLSQTVINQHGGKIWLHSNVGKGTTVYIQLPLRH